MSSASRNRARHTAAPAVALTAEHRWVLRRAFGPAEASGPAVDGDAVLGLTRALDLAPRIADRTPYATLVRELGSGPAERLVRSRFAAAAAWLALGERCREVAVLAAAGGLEVAVLKGAALVLGGHAAAGARPTADLDVLVAAAAAPELQRRLVAAGHRGLGQPGYDHHLPPVEAGGVVVEVHHRLPGVVVEGVRDPSLPALVAAGLTRELAPGLRVPMPPLLVAHLLAHALGQHRDAPQAYPGLRVLGDLLDLGLAAPQGAALEAEALALLAPALRDEAATAVALGRALADGEGFVALAAEAPPRRLLDHLLAGSLDAGYAARLRVRWPGRHADGTLGPREAIRGALAALWLTRGQIDALYGPPRHPLGYVVRRLLRPFHLVGRVVRHAAGHAPPGRRRAGAA